MASRPSDRTRAPPTPFPPVCASSSPRTLVEGVGPSVVDSLALTLAVGVCDGQGRLVGAVSQSDISDKVAAENKCPAWMRVSEIMSTDLITVSPQESLDECLRLMDKHGFYHLLVVGDKGAYQGMISVHDLLKVIASNEKARADMLESFLFQQR